MKSTGHVVALGGKKLLDSKEFIQMEYSRNLMLMVRVLSNKTGISLSSTNSLQTAAIGISAHTINNDNFIVN